MRTKYLKIIAVSGLLFASSLIGCMSGVEDNSAQHRKIVEAYVTAYNSHIAEEVARLYDPNAMLLYSDSPTPRFGRDEVISGLEVFFRAFPDVQMDYSFFMSDSTFFCIEGVWRGTHGGPLQSTGGEVPATGNKIEMPFCMIAEVGPDGLIVSDRGYYNVQAFIKQLFPQGIPMLPPDSETGK